MNRIYALFLSFGVMIFMVSLNLPQENFYNDDYERVISYNNDLYQFHNSDTLTIAIEKDAPGVFLYNGSYYGYLNAIFREYALSTGKILKIVSCDSQRELIKLLNSDSIAFGVTISSKDGLNSESNHFFIPDIRDSSRYVLLGHTNNKLKNSLPIEEVLDSSRVIYKRGSKEIDFLAKKSLDYLRDSSSARFMTTWDYVGLVRNEEYDFLICKEEEAFFYCYNYKNIVKTHQLEQWVYSILMGNKRNRTLNKEFSKWLEEFKQSEIYDEIVNYYHNKNYFKNFLEDGFLNPIRSISHFDDLFRSKTKNTPYDWKLLAAIAYVESKFNPFEKSHRGAIGIMQITPRNARYWGADGEDELRQPKINIGIAVKLLNENMRMMKLKGKVLTDNDTRILLACYNAGYGHISDAARLAKKYGENPKSWSVIKKYLGLKKSKEYHNQTDVVHSGSFSSKETEKYVESVMTKYAEYKKSFPNN